LRVRLWAGVAAVSVGLSLGISAAYALWYDQDGLKAAQVRRGAVGFAVTRDPAAIPVAKTDPGRLAGPPVDGTAPKYSLFDEYADASFGQAPDQVTIAGAVSLGTTLSGQLTDADAGAAALGDLYARYAVDARAQGNARLTYAPELAPPGGGPIGMTSAGTALLYYAGTDPDVTCDAAFFAAHDDPAGEGLPRVVYQAGQSEAGDLDQLPPVVGLDYADQTGQHFWCLKIAQADDGAHRDEAEIAVGTAVGDKIRSDSWSAAITYSDAPEDQLIVAFTPTVSRWDQ
jgi:hypothetical protein